MKQGSIALQCDGAAAENNIALQCDGDSIMTKIALQCDEAVAKTDIASQCVEAAEEMLETLRICETAQDGEYIEGEKEKRKRT